MRRDKNGFTLAELLIVVAIIAVLVAVSIPIFTSQLEKSREATDAANIRAQYAEVMVEAISEGRNVNVDGSELPKVELKQKRDDWQNTTLENNLHSLATPGDGGPHVIGSPAAGGTAWASYQDGVVTIHYEDGTGGGSGGGEPDPGGSDPSAPVPPGTTRPVIGLKLPATSNHVEVKSPVEVELQIQFIVHNGSNGNGAVSGTVNVNLAGGEIKTVNVPAGVKNSSMEIKLISGSITEEQLAELITSIHVK